MPHTETPPPSSQQVTAPDPQANTNIERIVAAHADLVLRLAYARLGSTGGAQDICQQVFLKLVDLSRRGLAAFASPEHEKAWVIRATVNACANEGSSAWNTRVLPLDPGAPEAPAREPAAPPSDDPALVVELAAEHAAVHAALAELTPAQRQAVYLRYYEGYAVKDIAELTGETPNTVSQHLSRARTKLRDILQGGAK